MYSFSPRRCAQSGKIMYHEKALAERAADQSWIERGAQLWVYRCASCTQWHLTSSDPMITQITSVPAYARKPRSKKRGYRLR